MQSKQVQGNEANTSARQYLERDNGFLQCIYLIHDFNIEIVIDYNQKWNQNNRVITVFIFLENMCGKTYFRAGIFRKKYNEYFHSGTFYIYYCAYSMNFYL